MGANILIGWLRRDRKAVVGDMGVGACYLGSIIMVVETCMEEGGPEK